MGVKPPRVKSAARKAARRTKNTLAKVPGPSSNPATNLLVMDVAMRGLSMITGRAIEKALLRMRYSDGKAADIVKGRSMVRSMAATSAARVATRSVPGFLLVTGGMLAKAVFDRSLGRRESIRRGEESFEKQADNVEE